MGDISTDTADLSKTFSGRLLLPADPEWNTARRIHNGSVDKRPALISHSPCVSLGTTTSRSRSAAGVTMSADGQPSTVG